MAPIEPPWRESLMNAAETARATTPLSAIGRLVMVSDERESPWVVDIASGRIVRRKPFAEPADATDLLASS